MKYVSQKRFFVKLRFINKSKFVFEISCENYRIHIGYVVHHKDAFFVFKFFSSVNFDGVKQSDRPPAEKFNKSVI